MSNVRVDCMGEHGDGVNEGLYFTVMVSRIVVMEEMKD
jgi:hypothetical protein